MEQCNKCGREFKNQYGVTVHQRRTKGPNCQSNKEYIKNPRKSRGMLLTLIQQVLAQHPDGLDCHSLFKKVKTLGYKSRAQKASVSTIIRGATNKADSGIVGSNGHYRLSDADVLAKVQFEAAALAVETSTITATAAPEIPVDPEMQYLRTMNDALAEAFLGQQQVAQRLVMALKV